MVLRRHPLGDPHTLQPETLRRTDQRAGHRELQPLVPEQLQAAVPTATSHLSEGNLRPHVGVLENQRDRPATILRNPSVSAEEESWFCAHPVMFPVTFLLVVEFMILRKY